MPASQAATLHDVAAAAGVSHMTVHRALAGSSLVRDETRRRVAEVAERLGYRPNLTARAMRTRKASRIGLLCSTDWGRTHLTIGLLVGLHDVLHREGLSLSLLRCTDEELLDHDLLASRVRQNAGDGLVVAYENHQPQELAQMLEEFHIPTVWYNVRRDADCVHNDDLHTGRAAAERLIGLGHRRILYFCQSYEADDPFEHYSAADRCAGAAAACAEAGAQLVVRRGRRLPPARAAFADSALAESGATAAICYSGSAAWQLRLAVERRGGRIPNDLALVSCDGDWGGYQPVTLAGFAPDLARMGSEAARALVKRIENPRIHLKPQVCAPLVLTGTGTLARPA